MNKCCAFCSRRFRSRRTDLEGADLASELRVPLADNASSAGERVPEQVAVSHPVVAKNAAVVCTSAQGVQVAAPRLSPKEPDRLELGSENVQSGSQLPSPPEVRQQLSGAEVAGSRLLPPEPIVADNLELAECVAANAGSEDAHPSSPPPLPPPDLPPDELANPFVADRLASAEVEQEAGASNADGLQIVAPGSAAPADEEDLAWDALAGGLQGSFDACDEAAADADAALGAQAAADALDVAADEAEAPPALPPPDVPPPDEQAAPSESDDDLRLFASLFASDNGDAEEDSDAAEDEEVAVAANERWIAWVSLDPRGDLPCIQVYPGQIAVMIEKAREGGRSQCDLGSAFFGATVNFGDRPDQRTGRGRRDVKRIAMEAQGGEIRVLTTHGRYGWRVAYDGNGMDAIADVPADCAVDVTCLDETIAEEKRKLAESAAVTAAQVAALQQQAAEDSTNELGLWEWCRHTGVSERSCETLPGSSWGVYSEETNCILERAFQAREKRASISVGIREYEVVFSAMRGFACQEDSKLRKRRLIRRRVVTQDEYRKALTPDVVVTTRGEDTCALCAEKFSDTAAMPTVELPVCLHVFHQACAQQLVDEGAACPCCRREVDWTSLPAFRRG